MKLLHKATLILLILGLFFCLHMYLLIQNDHIQAAHKKSEILTHKETLLLKSGDIILRKGFGNVSENIAKNLNEKYRISHCGLIYCKDSTHTQVIHSVSSSLSDYDGIQINTLKRFLNESQANSVIVVRFKNVSNTQKETLIKDALQMLERQIPFDNSFDLSTPDKIYCSEFIWKLLLKNCNFDLYPNKKLTERIKFSPFFDSTFFEIIINKQLCITIE